MMRRKPRYRLLLAHHSCQDQARPHHESAMKHRRCCCCLRLWALVRSACDRKLCRSQRSEEQHGEGEEKGRGQSLQACERRAPCGHSSRRIQWQFRQSGCRAIGDGSSVVGQTKMTQMTFPKFSQAVLPFRAQIVFFNHVISGDEWRNDDVNHSSLLWLFTQYYVFFKIKRRHRDHCVNTSALLRAAADCRTPGPLHLGAPPSQHHPSPPPQEIQLS